MSSRTIINEAGLKNLIQLHAMRTGLNHVKYRAKAYARHPMDLDTLVPGLSQARPEVLISVAKQLLWTEQHAPRRWFGFGGEVIALNARAALLLGRTLRRTTARWRLHGR